MKKILVADDRVENRELIREVFPTELAAQLGAWRSFGCCGRD